MLSIKLVKFKRHRIKQTMKLDKSIQISSMYLFSSPKGSRVLGHLGKVDCQALVCLV